MRAVRALLPDDEEILWAAASRGPTWREWFTFVTFGLFGTIFFFMAGATPPGPILQAGVVCLLVLVVWHLAGSWFYVFAATPRRVIILRTLPPRSWIFADLDKLDPGWLRVDSGRGKIQFGQRPFDGVFEPSGRWSSFSSQRGGMRTYIDNVPDIEAVRTLMLNRIADAHAQRNGKALS